MGAEIPPGAEDPWESPVGIPGIPGMAAAAPRAVGDSPTGSRSNSRVDPAGMSSNSQEIEASKDPEGSHRSSPKPWCRNMEIIPGIIPEIIPIIPAIIQGIILEIIPGIILEIMEIILEIIPAIMEIIPAILGCWECREWREWDALGMLPTEWGGGAGTGWELCPGMEPWECPAAGVRSVLLSVGIRMPLGSGRGLGVGMEEIPKILLAATATATTHSTERKGKERRSPRMRQTEAPRRKMRR